MLFKTAFVALAAALSARAHGGVTSIIIGGTTLVGWSPYNSASNQSTIERPYSSYDPILSATASTIHCNNNGGAGSQQLSANITAGSQITAVWAQWTHAEGPVMVYMAACGGSCTSKSSASLKWFKIAHTGLISGTVGKGVWGNTNVLNTLKYTSTIPSVLAAGEYLIRWELLALHQANTPQFYPECAQLIVTGGGGQTPSGSYLVSFPGAYSASDPSININIYDATTAAKTSYAVPGPAIWPGGTSTDPGTTQNPSTTSDTTTRPSTTTTTTGGCTVAKYGQCGGQGYAGCTVCASGSTCVKTNDFYSQCL